MPASSSSSRQTPFQMYPNLFPPPSEPESPLSAIPPQSIPRQPPQLARSSAQTLPLKIPPTAGPAQVATESKSAGSSEGVQKPVVSKKAELARFEVLETLGPSLSHPLDASRNSPDLSSSPLLQASNSMSDKLTWSLDVSHSTDCIQERERKSLGQFSRPRIQHPWCCSMLLLHSISGLYGEGSGLATLVDDKPEFLILVDSSRFVDKKIISRVGYSILAVLRIGSNRDPEPPRSRSGADVDMDFVGMRVVPLPCISISLL